jgi:hypothetical protein
VSGAEPWAPERGIAGLLEHYKVIDGVDCIPVEAFTLVANCISQFHKRPPTDADMAKLKALGSKQVAGREILDRAADILRGEIRRGKWKDVPGLSEHNRRWEEAISVLEMPRGATENPHSWLRGTKTGQRMRAWSYCATEIATYVMQVLKDYGVRASMRHTSGLVKFIQDALKFIGINNVPSESQISKVLRKNLAPIDLD